MVQTRSALRECGLSSRVLGGFEDGQRRSNGGHVVLGTGNDGQMADNSVGDG